MEQAIHGQSWDTFHQGYFSSAAVVGCFIDAIGAILADDDPGVVVDLGGGTGFLLARLQDKEMPAGTTLVNLDCSPAQLDVAAERGIVCRCCSIADFRRSDLAPDYQRFLFVMRSVLHYFGREGLPPLLRHLRGQAREGEFFVHQTACFEHRQEADCLNDLYREMATAKWYPTLDELRHTLQETGWETIAALPAPPLPLTGADLAQRYGLDPETVSRLRREIAPRFADLPHLLRLEPETFCVDLHYRILVCRAVASR